MSTAQDNSSIERQLALIMLASLASLWLLSRMFSVAVV